MRIKSFNIEGFRSIRDMTGDMDRVTVLVGPNGVGKSNLYRALELLHLATNQQLAQAIATEGGMKSVRWAGSKKSRSSKNEIKISVRFEELEYELKIGEETPNPRNPFQDPFIKTEKIWARIGPRVEVINRAGPLLKYRNDEGRWEAYAKNVATNESILSQLREPERFPMILRTRMAITNWRFFHSFRTDPDSPLRQRQAVYRTPGLNHDASNLAATLLSIKDGRNQERLASVIKSALPKSTLRIVGDGVFRELAITLPTISRPMIGTELSDGTLRFFALAAALLSEESPDFIVLNEPETSLHESTFPALAEAIEYAAMNSQLLIVTHSLQLANEIENRFPARVRTLRWDDNRGTRLDNQVEIED